MLIQTANSHRNVPIGSDKLSRKVEAKRQPAGLAAAFHFCFNSFRSEGAREQ